MVTGKRSGLYLSVFLPETQVREDALVYSLPLPGGGGFPDPSSSFQGQT